MSWRTATILLARISIEVVAYDVWILSRYILREHVGPFLFALFVVLFVLILDFIPQMLDLIIGKNIAIWTVLKLLVLNLAWMLALAVPMAVLVCTLMAFGRLTGDKEILAIKSLGINMVRLMFPVIVAASLMGVGLIWFNNNVLPDANHAAANLRSDIGRLRPTFQLRPGVFVNDIPGYVILVDHVDHVQSKIWGVVIYDRTNPSVTRTITADSGVVEFSPQGESVTFHLMDGQLHEQDLGKQGSYRLSEFRSQTFKVENLDTELKETKQEYRGDREMSSGMLLDRIHGFEKELTDYKHSVLQDSDSLVNMVLSQPQKITDQQGRTNEQWERMLVGQTYTDFVSINRLMKTRRSQLYTSVKSISKYRVEVHKKYSLAAACLTFILIGAPLGVVSRRGSMAMSVGISIGLFTVYWAFLIGGEQLADRLIVAPWVAMWAANILMVAVGLLLLYWVKSEKSFVAALRSVFWRSENA
jgi:lipopolysaccharide export system permease protein